MMTTNFNFILLICLWIYPGNIISRFWNIHIYYFGPSYSRWIVIYLIFNDWIFILAQLYLAGNIPITQGAWQTSNITDIRRSSRQKGTLNSTQSCTLLATGCIALLTTLIISYYTIIHHNTLNYIILYHTLLYLSHFTIFL